MNQSLKSPMSRLSIAAIRSRLTPKVRIMISVAVALLGVAALSVWRDVNLEQAQSLPQASTFPPQTKHEKAHIKGARFAAPDQKPVAEKLLIPITAESSPSKPAATLVGAANAQAVSLITSASGGTAKVVKVFQGPAGLIAVAYKIPDGRSGLAWVDPSRQLVLLGQLLNAQGQNLSAAGSAFVAYAGAQQATSDESESAVTPALAAAIKGAGINVAGNGPQVSLYLDPNSPEDRTEYMTLASLAGQNKLSLRVVPVAYLRASSLNRAEDILVALSPKDELRKNEINFDSQHKRGGAGKLGNNVQMMSVVDANTQLLASAGQVQTPAIFWCNKDGQAQALYGPMSTQALMQLAAQAHTCPGAPQG
jgi:thiol:disulfide interchange protein DsbG